MNNENEDDLYGLWLRQQMAASQAQQSQYQAILGSFQNQANQQTSALGGLFVGCENMNNLMQIEFENRSVILTTYKPISRHRSFIQRIFGRPYDSSQDRPTGCKDLVMPVGSMREA